MSEGPPGVGARTLARLERLASRPLGAVVLFALGLADYAVQAVAWPLAGGRDIDEYLIAYVQLFDRHVLLPWSLLFRGPMTPLVDGAALDLAGGKLAEPLLAVLFAGSVVAWSAAGRAFGPRVALGVALVLLLYPGYALMFHELASEPVFAAGFALLAWLVTRAAMQPSATRFAFVGLGVALVVLTRPGNAVLLALALFPFVLGGRWRERVGWAGAFSAAAILPLVAWGVHNGLRFGDYTVARGGNAVVPFYRAFVVDHIVSPKNGPASRRLADAMQEHLLTRDPYRSYGVTLDELFAKGSFRVHEDLYVFSDEVFGWKDNYAVLRDAGIEGIRAHPWTYTANVSGTIWHQLSRSYFRTLSTSSPGPSVSGQPATVVVEGRRLPEPSEGQPIPPGQKAWISTPDHAVRQVWTSPTHWHYAFRTPEDRTRFDAVERRVSRLFRRLPHRGSSSRLALRLNQASRWFPRSDLWILVGIVALVWRRPRGASTLVALALAAFLVVVLNALGQYADQHFVLPVAPAFVLFGLGALLGERESASSTT
jgi:Dolichyl-phosphate-mannose-protein mannosyltransferase